MFQGGKYQFQKRFKKTFLYNRTAETRPQVDINY